MSKLSVTETDRFIGKRIQQKRKELGFIPVSEDSIRDRLYTHLDRLSADKKRGLLVFLETIL